MARARGTIVLLGETPPDGRAGCDLSPVIERELTVVGARTGSLGEGVELLRSGTADLDGLITRRFRLNDAADAFKAAADPAQIAVVVDVDR
jgi:threonine dehydrogenase-like Zn-dependent dehydrogenase